MAAMGIEAGHNRDSRDNTQYRAKRIRHYMTDVALLASIVVSFGVVVSSPKTQQWLHELFPPSTTSEQQPAHIEIPSEIQRLGNLFQDAYSHPGKGSIVEPEFQWGQGNVSRKISFTSENAPDVTKSVEFFDGPNGIYTINYSNEYANNPLQNEYAALIKLNVGGKTVWSLYRGNKPITVEAYAGGTKPSKSTFVEQSHYLIYPFIPNKTINGRFTAPMDQGFFDVFVSNVEGAIQKL